MQNKEVKTVVFFFLRICLNLYNYQSNANRYNSGLTYLKTRVATNQKHSTDSQNKKKEAQA